MKKLKKILLINWLYFSKQLIEVGDINFITGKNGAGKSTIIDALQIVFLGEISTNNFNKAASGTSHRTVDGYLRGDIDPQNNKSRRGKDFASYIACEFYDDVEKKSFVAGINFDCRSDGSYVDHFFLYEGVIPDHCYIQEQTAMDISDLRKWLKQEKAISSYKIFDRRNEYREELLSRWNVHNEQVCQMLKRAVSFKPIVDIQKFITENICDTMERPDIELMQQNIRDYKRQEQLAQRVEQKVVALQEIGASYERFKAVREQHKQQTFVAQWAGKQAIAANIAELEAELQAARDEIEVDRVGFESIKAEHAAKDRERMETFKELNQDPNRRRQAELEKAKRTLEKEDEAIQGRLRRLLLEIRQEAQVLSTFAQKIVDDEQLQEAQQLQASADEILQLYRPLTQVEVNCLEEPVEYFHKIQEGTTSFAGLLNAEGFKWQSRLQQLQEEKAAKTKILQSLENNIKDYPPEILRLRDELRERLAKQFKRAVEVNILADVLEITAGCEAWRGVVEGYLNKQKFYLLVEPEAYEEALKIYDLHKKNYKNSWGLVDVAKIREHEKLQQVENSLAQKVETENSLARTFIDYLLGRVVCCEQVADLRRYRIAVTVEGMLYQGYVARPLAHQHMEDSFIGQHAIEIRREAMLGQIAALKKQITGLQQVTAVLHGWEPTNMRFNDRFVQMEIKERKLDYTRGQAIEQELKQVMDELTRLDLFYSEQLKKKLEVIEKELETLVAEREKIAKEIGMLEVSLKTREEKLPKLREEAGEREAAIYDNSQFNFDQEYQTAIGLPAYEAALQQYRTVELVEKKATNSLPGLRRKLEDANLKLRDLRQSYVSRFQPCSFNTQSEDNHEFAAELQLLQDNQLPIYLAKIKRSRASALAQFQSDFVGKLRSGIESVQRQVKNLNKALRQGQFGADKYQFKVEKNPDYAEYYEMIMSQELLEGTEGLFSYGFQEKYGKLVEELFSRIVAADAEQVNARQQSELQQNIERFTDFRTYLKFDLETTSKNGTKQLLSKTLNKKSGGETQTPFYIAVLAAFAQLYHVDNPSVMVNNTVRLVLFDEAFNKMDSERIVESVKLLRKLGLQAIICTPPDKMPDIAPLADYSIPVVNEGYRMQVIPYSKEVLQQWQQEQ